MNMMTITDTVIENKYNEQKIFRLKVNLGCFRSIKALFWKSEIDFQCMLLIEMASEHERVKKKETFALSLKVILS